MKNIAGNNEYRQDIILKQLNIVRDYFLNAIICY